MSKRITDNQVLGELGETAVKKIVLETGFIYENRGRLEAGTDGLIELRDPRSGAPLGKLLGVQVKATARGQYIRETDRQFEYVLKADDLAYWRRYNIPVIIVLWRQSDGSAYWKDVTDSLRGDERRLRFDKDEDVFGPGCADRLAALTIDRHTPGVYLPPLNTGENAIMNMMRIRPPDEIFVASSPFGTGRDAIPDLLKQKNTRFDWVIRKRRFVSFFDPREFGTSAIVDLDQVEAVETALFTQNDDPDDTNDTIDLLRRSVVRQISGQISHLAKERLFYFHALGVNKSRRYKYASSVKDASARVVGYYPNKKFPDKPGYVRHHAANFRFERLGDEWFIVIDPTFYFTRNGFIPHPFPGALLAGKKRLERNAAVRGQVIMWQSLLAESAVQKDDLFEKTGANDHLIGFEHLPLIELAQAVPEDTWNRTDPRAREMEAADLFEEGLSA
ncbi:MAG: DUF4365 domain-containing protein [Zhengella sp.]|jgi:hypothetical protein|uniref:DUF4365 domain-containing protein n=1 Tax=Nitratireductor arenosus TaxID=2682096 RepID=A0A844QQV8_9HYPH|nr:DUF4365 domain-containing protein [Nitratireductor arenosus]MVA99959.1 DUF4365 domain-containing protein [Nitratireductor arenosus]